jgi:hypothetical protein|uniref:Uncharacterized protein n=1 Tax=Aliivibrio wodanis TaxID=80852 RepID=A0A5Q4YZ86_9GAMM|nr:hypothetical protein AW0309160_03918 [Aliivibrio wodanis]
MSTGIKQHQAGLLTASKRNAYALVSVVVVIY